MATLQARLADLITAIGTDWKNIWSNTGNKTDLTTTDKTTLVAAINEVKASSGSPSDASETVKGIIEIATLAEVATGTDAVRAVTAAGVRQERTALKAEILGAGVPSALDTLDELAAALGDDANFGSTVTTALGNRLRIDVNNQGLNGTQQQNGRTNLNAYGATELGDPDTNLVSLYTTAKA